MLGVNKLTFLTADQRTLLETSETNYKRFGRIFFSIVSYNDGELIVKVWQEENTATNKYLNQKELIDRAKDVFTPILPDGVKLHVRPIEYKANLLKNLSVADIDLFMGKYSLKQKDLTKFLNIDAANLNRLLTGQRELTNIHRTMFFYFMEWYELTNN